MEEMADVYESMIGTPGGRVYGASIRDKIPFPHCETSYLDSIPQLTNIFEFKEGAHFLQDCGLSKSHVVQLTNHQPTVSSGHVHSNPVKSLYGQFHNPGDDSQVCRTILPAFWLSAAQAAVRNGLDPRAAQIIGATGKVVDFGGDIGLFVGEPLSACVDEANNILHTASVYCQRDRVHRV